MGSFCPNQKIHDLKNYRGAVGMNDEKNDEKFEEEMTCQFKIYIRNSQVLTRGLENLKNLSFNGLLLTKYIMF